MHIIRMTVVVLALAAGCKKSASSLVQTQLGKRDLFINLPAGVTVKEETPTTFSLDRGTQPFGLINDSGSTEWPDRASLDACGLDDPQPFESANVRGVTCAKDGKVRTIAYVKIYNSTVKNVQSCNIDNNSRDEGKEICMTLSGPRAN